MGMSSAAVPFTASAVVNTTPLLPVSIQSSQPETHLLQRMIVKYKDSAISTQALTLPSGIMKQSSSRAKKI